MSFLLNVWLHCEHPLFKGMLTSGWHPLSKVCLHRAQIHLRCRFSNTCESPLFIWTLVSRASRSAVSPPTQSSTSTRVILPFPQGQMIKIASCCCYFEYLPYWKVYIALCYRCGVCFVYMLFICVCDGACARIHVSQKMYVALLVCFLLCACAQCKNIYGYICN